MSDEAECARLERGAPGYPPLLVRRLGEAAPPVLVLRGDPALLRRPLTALFCSVRVPAELVLPAFDLVRALSDRGTPVIGGFHSPVERDCLEHLLRGPGPVVAAPARAVSAARLAPPWREAAMQGRLLVLSPFERVRRPSHALAVRRNRLVAALSARIVVVHATPGGRLAAAAAEALKWGLPVHCLPHPSNHDLLLRGATAVPDVAWPAPAADG